MIDTEHLTAQLKNTVLATTNNVIEHLPGILGAIILLFIGWVIARMVRAATSKLLGLLNHFLERILSGRTRAVVRFSSGVTELVAGVLFWIILFVFTTAALHTAGLEGLATWLQRIVEFLPSILTGVLIILIGYVLSLLVKDLTLVAAHSAELAEAPMISRLAQVITLITALVIGLDLIGVDVTFLTTMLGVSTAALLGGFALAFGLGARSLVSNLIAAHYLKDILEAGQKIRIGDYEGTVLELSATTVILETAGGRTSIPAKLYQEQALIILVTDADND